MVEPVPVAPQDAPFPDPLVEGGETTDAEAADPEEDEDVAAEGLIPLVSADAAVRLAAQGRSNPFATIPVPENVVSGGQVQRGLGDQLPQIPNLPQMPVPLIPQIGPRGERTPSAPSTNIPQIPQLPQPPVPLIPQFPQTPQSPQSPQGPGGPPSSPDEPFEPDLPELPTPTLAQGLKVTGVVVQPDGRRVAIVESSDGKSRYVREGEYLEGGQVLVKRIEPNRGGTPRVVFEELGIEVVKVLGEGGTPTAAYLPLMLIQRG
ncbi:hypothetical protein VB712_16850 [Spirulina sp. CCNP1310]|nr:hypothetical protein [Spirulina sp. CCNP1310]